jgi:hypothetical protein
MDRDSDIIKVMFQIKSTACFFYLFLLCICFLCNLWIKILFGGYDFFPFVFVLCFFGLTFIIVFGCIYIGSWYKVIFYMQLNL